MSELRSTIEALRGEVLLEQPDAQLEEDFLELHRAIEQLEAERLRRLAEIDRRRLFARDGHLSVASWLVARLRLTWGAARGQARMARALELMPATRCSLESGELPLAACRVLADAQHLDPEAFARTEVQLVEAAKRHPVGDLHRFITHWRERTSAEAGDPEAGRRAARRLHASRTFMGMVRVDADPDPETGGSLLAALRAALDAEGHAPSTVTTGAPPPSAVPTPWVRSAGDGWIWPTVLPWPVSDLTSRSSSMRRRSALDPRSGTIGVRRRWRSSTTSGRSILAPCDGSRAMPRSPAW